MTVADRFTGQVALITGGARGIGAATAARLAAEGADVVIADFDLAAAEETAAAIGGRAVQCDVTSREQVEATVAAAAGPTGRLDILVTCAGIIRDNLLHKMTDDDWGAVIDTHLRGTFLAAQAAQKLMVAQKSGTMVLISSTSALGNRGQANYSAAKAGIQGLAKTLAIELGPFGITVNSRRAGLHRDGDDRADRGADGGLVRGVHGGGGGADTRATGGSARRRRRRDRVPLLRRRLLRQRPGHLRARRPVTGTEGARHRCRERYRPCDRGEARRRRVAGAGGRPRAGSGRRRESRSPPTWRRERAIVRPWQRRSSASAGSTRLSPTPASSTSRRSRTFDEDRWDALLAVLLTSPFLLARYAWPHLKASGESRILVVASVHGLVASPFKAGYVAAKHGVIGLVKTLALEGAEHGIRAVAVCPGFVRTPARRAAGDRRSPSSAGSREDEALRDVLLEPQALKELIEPEEVAGVAAFLLGPGGRSFSGAPVVLDNGWTAR